MTWARRCAFGALATLSIVLRAFRACCGGRCGSNDQAEPRIRGRSVLRGLPTRPGGFLSPSGRSRRSIVSRETPNTAAISFDGIPRTASPTRRL